MESLELERKYAPVTLQDMHADGSFSGYASLFGEVDLGNDMMERGAFARARVFSPSKAIRPAP